MPPPAIRVRNLSKKYQIGAREARPTSFREALTGALASPFRRFQSLRGTSSQAETFWALKDVSFDIEEGEVVGVIGRNGAGKSTLLKILSQITEPTSGEVELHGRVGSLLEVGTGFHPELSGRENIYLNGAILGMKREEITKRFDEIVAFAEVEQFLDTPVKRYSSGMYMRLAFAVAAYLESEVLIIDEVLAVGDMPFQKRCLSKMGSVAKDGRTVVFVSHNLYAVRALCSRLCVLQRGCLEFDGNVVVGLSHYSGDLGSRGNRWLRNAPSSGPIVFSQISTSLTGSQPHHQLWVDMVLTAGMPHRPAFIAVDISDDLGDVIMQAVPLPYGFIQPGQNGHRIRIAIDLPPMIPGTYLLTAWMGPHNTETYDMAANCVSFVIDESPTEGRSFPHTRDHGAIVPRSTLYHDPLA